MFLGLSNQRKYFFVAFCSSSLFPLSPLTIETSKDEKVMYEVIGTYKTDTKARNSSSHYPPTKTHNG